MLDRALFQLLNLTLNAALSSFAFNFNLRRYTPVGDFGEQKKRMERIRAEVEWRRVGCELQECQSDL